MNGNLYCAIVLNQCTFFYWKYLLEKFMFDNKENKYKYSLEQVQDNIMYDKSCFVTSFE
jgi:hypothetical protein